MIYCFLYVNDYFYRSTHFGFLRYSRTDGKARSNKGYTSFYEIYTYEKGYLIGLDKVQKYNNIHLFINDII